MQHLGVFWNLQRMFDPAGLPVARALGATAREWTAGEYRRKLSNVGACLRALTRESVPAVLGLAEVESLRVLRDLRAELGWDRLVIVDEVAAEPSLDGLDVALMLDGALFDVSSIRARSLSLDNRFATRDLLDVRVRLRGSGDEVALFAAHWPSRIIAEGEALRFSYSVYLYRLLVSVLKFSKSEIVQSDGSIAMPEAAALLHRWSMPCIIMGDFNDEPYDPSIRTALNSSRFRNIVARQGRLTGKSLIEPDNYLRENFVLYNPCWSIPFSDSVRIGGSYYRGEWRSYDQVLFTHGALADKAAIRYVEGSLEVGRVPDITGADGAVRVSMRKSTGTPRGFEADEPHGVSDHFPIMFSMEFPDAQA